VTAASVFALISRHRILYVFFLCALPLSSQAEKRVCPSRVCLICATFCVCQILRHPRFIDQCNEAPRGEGPPLQQIMALLTLSRVIKCQWPDLENPPSKFKSYLFVQLVVKISLLFLVDFLRDLCDFTRPYAPNFIHFILSNAAWYCAV
jgi:hypothetical protein